MDRLQICGISLFLVVVAIAAPVLYPFLFLSSVLAAVLLGAVAIVALFPSRKARGSDPPYTGTENGKISGDVDGFVREPTGSTKAPDEVRAAGSGVDGNLPDEETASPLNAVLDLGVSSEESLSIQELPGGLQANVASGTGLGQTSSDLEPASESQGLADGRATNDKNSSVQSTSVPLPQAEESLRAPDLSKLKESVSASPGARAMAAALRARSSRSVPQGHSDLLVLYGSQTGNAMEIARAIAAEAPSRGIKSRVFAMNDFPLAKLARSTSIQFLVVVVSSTGDGDPPENCDRFYHGLRKATEPNHLKNVRFTVCGLGDSNYTKFMGVPKLVNSRLLELGAQRFFKSCEADDVEGLEDVVDKWTAELWGTLKAAIQSTPLQKSGDPEAVVVATDPEPDVKLVGVPPLQPCRVRLVWDEDEKSGSLSNGLVKHIEGDSYSSASPFWAPVCSARYMTAKWSDRKVIHATLGIHGSGITYRPGDSIGVIPVNDEELVDRLLSRLGIDGTKSFRLEGVQDGSGPVCNHIKFPCSVKTALLNYCSLTGIPSKGFLRMLAEYTSKPEEKGRLLQLCSRGGKDLYAKEILAGRPNVWDLLTEFGSCNPPLAHLFDSLLPLVCRYYSVSSAPVESPHTIDIAFSVVQFETKKDRLFKGVCTTWLERLLDLEAGDGVKDLQIPIFRKGGGVFCPPSDLSAPIIMIGPGTGVAPFRGFLQERRKNREHSAESAVGDSWLFFGCRRADEDYLYQEDFEGFAEDGTLSHFVVAFSRALEKKVYVQDKMREHAEALCAILLNNRTHVYICGDGANMAKDVHLALLQILQQHGGLKESMGIAHLNEMTKQGRYVRDIWS